MSKESDLLDQARVLILEDDYYLATDLQDALKAAGATVIGPFPDTADAARAITDDHPDCALVNLNLGRGISLELPRELARRTIPFAFVTGYNHAAIPEDFSGMARVENTTSHGITVWTHGTPAHRFRVLGTIRDERTDKLLDGNAVASAAVAKLVRAHGGNAVLVHGVNSKPIAVQRGGVGGVFGTPSYSGQGDVVIREVTTDLVVIQSGNGN